MTSADITTPDLATLKAEAAACRVCEHALPLGPRPTFRASETARVLIIGQAPGTRVHETGIPWNDRSGDRLREWLALDRETFYDEGRIAIVPMGLCYPGRDKNGGDAPPRPECAPLWQKRFRNALPAVDLTLLIGIHAQTYWLGDARKRRSMTETVRDWRAMPAGLIPLPHPSWRNTAWLRKNPWFEEDVVPELQRRVSALL